MKKSRRIFVWAMYLITLSGLLAIAMLGCSNGEKETECTDLESCSSSSAEENGDYNSSSDGEGEGGNNDSSSSGEKGAGVNDSSSSGEGNPETASSSSGENGANSSSSNTALSSSSQISPSSSSVIVAPGSNCAYLPIWCGGIAYDKVNKQSVDGEVGNTDAGQVRPDCIYAKEITQIGNESGGISINGTHFDPGGASRCGGDNGHGWGDPTSCAAKFASVAKKDGGYYIYVPAWAGQNFKTTGGEPTCSGSVPPPGTSSPSQNSSSSGVSGGTGNCVEPMYGVPPGGTTSCIKKGDKCYTCNPDRGNECNSAWIWQANTIDDYWYAEVNCGSSGGGGSALTCVGLAATGLTGTAITQPTVQCNGNRVTSGITWAGAPSWSNPTAGSYNVKATANCGGSNQTAECGTITVSAATSRLTCNSVTQAITTGQTPTKPTVTCGSQNVTTGITWSPASINGAINTAGTITGVTATANCGGSNQTANCSGTITVTAPSTPSSSSGGGGDPGYTPTSPGNESAKTTQYWDACKPSCSWSGKGGPQANSCNISGANIGHSDGDRSACDGGSAFTCMKQAPWKVGNVSFGYVAANMGTCGDCYQLDFPNGQVMVVMKSNIGNLNDGAAFDLMIPGGGVGDFDALTRQVQQSGVSNPNMGERYGGFRGACGWQGSGVAACVKQRCGEVFKNLPDLKAGCEWYPDVLGTDNASFNNPTVKYKKVTCPKALTDRY